MADFPNQSVPRFPPDVDGILRRTIQDIFDRVNFLVTDTAKASGVGAHTITLAKLTVSGTNGFITFNEQGIVTAFQDPT